MTKTLLLALLASLSTPLAQAAGEHSAHHASAPAAAAADFTEAEVKKIDAAQAKITLKHGEIKHLDMPPMTMVFRVRDPASLATLAVGDQVQFTADKLQGAYTVLQIRKRP